ncbi:MAG TPA: hypothetical protein VN228_00640 [Pyrinomonadaceae bacterium]|nr:hypothetical protein [Pyrinomonadaceae bacterium]
MSKLPTLKRVLSAVVFALALASAAQAQATRTFVSGTGNDADPCNRTAPCRTWAGAILKTAVNGEINALDAGGFGGLNITKSLTVDGNAAHSSTLTSSGNGFIINIAAGVANDPHRSVRLRNLSINGTGVVGTVGTRIGLDGIRFLRGTSLFVENVVINDMSLDGVEVAGPAGEANAMHVVLDGVQIRNCNGSGVKMSHANASGQIVAVLNNVRVHACAVGAEGTNRTRTGVRNSGFTHNTTGLRLSGSDNIMNVDDAFVSYATTGVQSSAGNTIRVSDTVITQNATGLNPNSGTITSLSGNSVNGNSADGSFTGAAVPKT